VSLEDSSNPSIFSEVDPLTHPPDNDMGPDHGHDLPLHEQGCIHYPAYFQLSF